MAIGLRYGTATPNDKTKKEEMLAKKAAFEEKFRARWGSCICREILGYDLSIPAEMEQIQAQQLLTSRCPQVVCDAWAVLEEVL